MPWTISTKFDRDADKQNKPGHWVSEDHQECNDWGVSHVKGHQGRHMEKWDSPSAPTMGKAKLLQLQFNHNQTSVCGCWIVTVPLRAYSRGFHVNALPGSPISAWACRHPPVGQTEREGTWLSCYPSVPLLCSPPPSSLCHSSGAFGRACAAQVLNHTQFLLLPGVSFHSCTTALCKCTYNIFKVNIHIKY